MKTENELIAEFMGIQVYQSYEAMQAVPLEELKEWRTPTQLGYHSSWNELMPVVEKINRLKPKNDFFIHITFIKTNIEEVYKAVIEFITWYNSQNPKP